MQSRLAFNSGEFSPDMACRSDIDQYTRACCVLENWNVSQTGGISRRRGMRFFADALGAESRLFPYIYSYSLGDTYRFLIEVSRTRLRVFSSGGYEVFSVASSDALPFSFDLSTLHHRQINKLLILTCSSQTPMALSYDNGSWNFAPFAFKHLPWRYNELRDWSISIVRSSNLPGQNLHDIGFPDDLPDIEKPDLKHGVDYLRASVYVDDAESGWTFADFSTRSPISIVSAVPKAAALGSCFAILGPPRFRYYYCTQAFSPSVYRLGFDFPENYPNNFQLVSDDSQYGDAVGVRSLNGVRFEAGSKIKFLVQYWEYWTCIKAFSNPSPSQFSAYPEYFMRGVPASDSLPCRSSWAFYCSGLWYGEYAVKRNYQSASHFDPHWETRAVSRSLYGAAANVQVSGNESDEECYVRLFLTRSFALSDASIQLGFIPDSCHNRLIVSSFRHDEIFRCTPFGSVLQIVPINPVQVSFAGGRVVENWSWAAFSSRYGYPLLCDVFQSRLVFASTSAQPQTLWMSRTDDLDNFLIGNVDDAALALTLNTTSQNPICWLLAQGNRIMLGTGEAEFALGSSSSLFTYKNAQATDHSHVGSSPVAALPVIDKVLYVERGGGRIYEFAYSLEVDGYVSRDLSVFASHILSQHGGALRSTLLRKPDTVAVFALADGQVALCTYNAHQDVKAWHRWVTDGTVLDVCALPDGYNADKLFLLVQRGYRVFIEVVDSVSAFVDNGERPYSSVVISNSLCGFSESPVSKRSAPPFAVYFGAPVDLERLQVCVTCNGGIEEHDWRLVNDNFASFSRGWHNNLIAAADCGLDRRIGFRVTGDAPFELLALQG